MSRESGRRLIHASTTLLLLIALQWSWTALRVVLAAGVPVILLLELARLRVPALAAWLAARVPVFRSGESRTVSGAVWLWIGYALASWFPPPAALGGILAGAVADPAASLIGSRWGGGAPKSWPGTAAAVAVAGATLGIAGLGWRAALAGALAGGALERWCRSLDDNLVVAPGVAAALWLLA